MFDAARERGEHRVTWEPKKGVRIVLVVVPTSKGWFVAAGRNMSEVQHRIGVLARLCLVFATTATVLLYALMLGTNKMRRTQE